MVRSLKEPTQVWGHSMGAAVASLAVASSAAPVNHPVLEAPFNNLADEVNVFLINEMILDLFWKRLLYLQVDDMLSKAFYGRLALPFLPTASILKAADLCFATDQVLLAPQVL